MSSVTTKAGTSLPLLNLKGKDYLQVAHRLLWFREEHPDGEIHTEYLQIGSDYAIAKATITLNGKPLATAHKKEDKQGFADYHEKAETGAIGRALALCGYGTQFAQELEEEHRIVDAPQAKPLQSKPVTVTPQNVVKATAAVVTQVTADSRANDLAILFKAKGWTKEEAKEYITKAYGVTSLKDLTLSQCQGFHSVLTKQPSAAVALDNLNNMGKKPEVKTAFDAFKITPEITEDDIPF